MIIIIGGATASGKSKLAVEAAKKLNGEIISADSMQIYQGLNIGTAKVTLEECCGVTHYGIDIAKPTEQFSVAEFNEYAKKTIKKIEDSGKTPIIVGGTGLYLRSLVYDFAFGGTDKHEEFRKEMTEYARVSGKEALYAKLKALNPEKAATIHYNNLPRVIRALEIETFGDGKQQEQPKRNENVLYFILNADRKALYDRINLRVDDMFCAGLEKEVRALIEKGVAFTNQSMQGIGYKEWQGYFSGDLQLEEVKDLIKKNSRAYAKRQQTWFKKEDGISLQAEDGIVNNVQKIADIYETKSNL